MKILKTSILILIVFFVDQILTGLLRWPVNYFILPTIILVSTRKNLVFSMYIGFALGFLSDIMALRSIPVVTIFLLVSVLLLNFISNKYLEFKSFFTLAVTTTFMAFLQVFILFIIYREPISVNLIYSSLASAIGGVLFMLVVARFFREDSLAK